MTVAVSKPVTAHRPGGSVVVSEEAVGHRHGVTAYREVDTYRGAAEMCGVTHKTVKRVIDRAEAAGQRTARRRNYQSVRALAAPRISGTKGRLSAPRLLPATRAADYQGSECNFRAACRAGARHVPAGPGAGALAPSGGVGAG